MAASNTVKNLVTRRGFAGAYALSYGMKYLAGERGIEGLVGALGGAAAMTFAAPAMYGYTAMQIGQAAGAWASNKIHEGRATQAARYTRNLGGSYVDTDQAYTMRQAGVNAMQESGMNMKQILGNEASFMHR